MQLCNNVDNNVCANLQFLLDVLRNMGRVADRGTNAYASAFDMLLAAEQGSADATIAAQVLAANTMGACKCCWQ